MTAMTEMRTILSAGLLTQAKADGWLAASIQRGVQPERWSAWWADEKSFVGIEHPACGTTVKMTASGCCAYCRQRRKREAAARKVAVPTAAQVAS